MRRAISAAAALALLGASGTADIDASLRAGGNDKAVAIQIGRALFARPAPAQILKVYANTAGGHTVAGLMLSGVKFHHALTRAAFTGEVVDAVRAAFAAAAVEEVDVWCVVPLSVGKGVVVSGDNAKPTQRTVFTISVRRGEAPSAVRARIETGKSVYWDALWVRQALVPGPAKQRG